MGIMKDAKKLPTVLGFSRSIAENIFSSFKNAAILIIYTISHYAEISTLVFFQIQSQVDGVLHFRPVKVIQKISAVNSGGCWKILQYILSPTTQTSKKVGFVITCVVKQNHKIRFEGSEKDPHKILSCQNFIFYSWLLGYEKWQRRIILKTTLLKIEYFLFVQDCTIILLCTALSDDLYP